MNFTKLLTGVLSLFIFLSSQCLLAQEPEEHATEGKHVTEENEYHHTEGSALSFGLGLPFTFNLNTIGFNSRLYYNTGEHWCFGPEFSFFKKGEAKIWSLDLVVHYIFETPEIGIYPVAGINFTKEIEEHHGSESAVGFLWGVGVHRNIKKFTVFLEFTRIESKLGDHFLTAGCIYRLNLHK